MPTFNWEFSAASKTDNYKLYDADGNYTLIDDVVTSVLLKVSAVDGDKQEIIPTYHVALAPPQIDNMIAIDNIDKAMVTQWALEAIKDEEKAAIEKLLEKRLLEPKPVIKQMFQEE
jgi:hypothetical protein